ncbi:MAG: hypothetical protein WC707_01605 [Candidatus Babeliaceae bacterium]
MKTIINLFKAFKLQIIGVLRLSGIIIFLYQLNSSILWTFQGRIMCSLMMGLYICYLNWQATKNLATSMQYTPSGECKELFDEIIRLCGMDPSTICLRYAYTDEAVAMAIFNTVVIDPSVWHGIEQDAAAIRVIDIVNTHITPTMISEKQRRLFKIKEALSLPAQRFIIKHELGHIYHNYTNKKLFIIGIIGVGVTYLGLITTKTLLGLFGAGAVFFGILVAGIADVILSYGSNVFFKMNEEKKADLFAVQRSSSEDIEAAILFFEQVQEIRDANPDPDNVFFKIPIIILSGHLDGKIRAAYLRSCKLRYV